MPKRKTKKTSKIVKSKQQNSLFSRVASLSPFKKMALFLVAAVLLSLAITPIYLNQKKESIKAKAWTISVPARTGDTALRYGFCFRQGNGGSVSGYVVKPAGYSNGVVYIKRFGAGSSGNPGSLKHTKASYGVWWGNEVKAASIEPLDISNWYELSYSGSDGKKSVNSSSGPIFGAFIPSCI